MDITRLDWDSKFFGFEIGCLLVNDNNIPSEAIFKSSGFKLVYIISTKKLMNSYINLVDEKVFLKCNLNENDLNADYNIQQFDPTIHSKKELINLNLKSGIYSRFYTDNNFSKMDYEKLYNQWITNCLEDTKNSIIIVKTINSKLAGFIALKEKKDSFDIQLLAVDPANRGLGIGSLLIQESKQFSLAKGFKTISVTTQLNNFPAMQLYKKNNFSISNIKNIFHYWNL